MADHEAVQTAIARGIRFLERRQQPDGSFISYSSAVARPFRRQRTWQTTFVPALMLASLAGLNDVQTLAVRKRLADFLLRQRQENGAFNYWAKGAPEYRSMAYPADLDDTFCALAALHLHDPSLTSEATLAQAVRLLLATEIAVGGPYRTWVVSAGSEPVWLDVDLAVNSNIAFFLSLTGNRIPSLDKLMDDAIVAGKFSSPYYPLPYAFVYYLARTYQGQHRTRLLALVCEYQAQAATDLDQALCIIARLHLGDTAVDNAAWQLLRGQRRDGSWAAAAFYADPVKHGRPHYNGGSELTTAFVLEALQAYISQNIAAQPVPRAGQRPNAGAVLAAARRQIRNLGPTLKPQISRSLARLASSQEGAEITGLPQLFHSSLDQSSKLPQTFLNNLGTANLYGWLAYTIYDDFLDDEGKPELLPVANAALRRSLQGFLETLPGAAEYHKTVIEIFDTIDAANAWELAQCRNEVRGDQIKFRRLPDYDDLTKLAQRSLGHILGPLAILYKEKAGGKVIRHCREGLQSYLVVRQLNDDLHDWQSDLANGHLSYVVCVLLKKEGIGKGTYTVPELIARLRGRFWHEVLPAICRDMQRRLAGARTELQAGGVSVASGNGMGELLDAQERIIQETLAKQRQAALFLEEYEGSAETP